MGSGCIANGISSGFWEWIKLPKTMKLIPVVALLLAATIDPFKSESHDLMIEVLHPTEIAAHSVVAVVSKQL